MRRPAWGAVALMAAGMAAPIRARDTLGMFDTWGAFRDDAPRRCFAIATPVDPSTGSWRPFAAIGHWPDRRVRGQFHARLSRERRRDADVILTIGDRRWRLLAGRYDAWGPTPRHDAFILAKIRAARSMSLSSVDTKGRPFADTYRLKGAATAMDTAALGCVRR